VPLDPAATRLEAPAGATVGAGGTVVLVPGEGRFELDRTAGTVLFTPEPAFTGTATPVPYVVTEVARPDTSAGEQGIPNVSPCPKMTEARCRSPPPPSVS